MRERSLRDIVSCLLGNKTDLGTHHFYIYSPNQPKLGTKTPRDSVTMLDVFKIAHGESARMLSSTAAVHGMGCGEVLTAKSKSRYLSNASARLEESFSGR